MKLVAAAVLLGLGVASAAGCPQETEQMRIYSYEGSESDTLSALGALLAQGVDAFLEGDASTGDAAVRIAATPSQAAAYSQTFALKSIEPAAKKVVPSGYSNLAAVNARLAEYAAAFPRLAAVVDMTDRYGGARTVEGRSIMGLKVSTNVSSEEDEPAVLVVAAHHSREIGSPEMVFGGIDLLLRGYAEGTEASIRRAVEESATFFVPVVNVDGYEYVFNTEAMWRKNRRPLQTACGVDLNRNYPAVGASLWDGSCSGSTNEGTDTYRGPYPVSERESSMLAAFHWAERPIKVLDFHQSGREVLYGYRCHDMPAAIEDWTVKQAQGLAAAASYALRKPSSDGEHPQHANGVATNYAFLVEVTTSFQPPYDTALAEVERVKPLLAHFFATSVSVVGHVTNSRGGAPIGGARVDVEELDYSNGEMRNAHGSFGRYGLWLPDGTWTLRYTAPGFSSTTRSVTVSEGITVTVDVSL